MYRKTTRKPLVLVVDDTPINLELASSVLSFQYEVLTAVSGNLALSVLAGSPDVELVLLDIMMPLMDGYEVCRRLKRNPATAHIPVLFLTSLTETDEERLAFEAGGVDFINKPFHAATLLARVATHVQLHAQERHLDALVKERTENLEARTVELLARTHELETTRLQVIYQLGRAAEYKDDATGTHVIRMARYSRLLAKLAGLPDDRVDMIYKASPMHDIGKLGIPDSILKKPGKLTVEEFEVMKRHPEIGAEIIGEQQSDLLECARVIALSHHEKWDGTGYPYGHAGNAIPIEGRIVAIADVFDALTSLRPYKPAFPIGQAMQMMQEQSGRHFDPELLALFFERPSELLKVRMRP